MLRPEQRIHIVGVGGFGMSAIARVLLARGFAVSGSDLHANDLTRALTALGLVFFEGQAADHISGADLVLATSAAKDDNPEIAAARAAGLPVLRRQDVLGALMADQVGIAVAGTHGKTTTSAMIAHLLLAAQQDPTYIVGGVLRNTGTNAAAGHGPHFVIEADEYDRMFLGLRPQIAVITNIEHDHPDIYPTLDDVRAAFAQFAALLPANGLLIACAADADARALGLAQRAADRAVSLYGIGRAVLRDDPAGWWADALEPEPSGGIRFTVYQGERARGMAQIALPGRHNVLNALAALVVAQHIGLPFDGATVALAAFQGTGRRSELLGTADNVTLINDYAHHPTEIRVTLEAQRALPGVRDVWAVWQPHTYGRLRTLADTFAAAFGAADHVLVTDVYSVREQITPGLDAAGIAARIRSAGHPDVRYTGALDATAAALVEAVRPGDRVVLLSAGDLPRTGDTILAGLRAHEENEP